MPHPTTLRPSIAPLRPKYTAHTYSQDIEGDFCASKDGDGEEISIRRISHPPPPLDSSGNDSIPLIRTPTDGYRVRTIPCSPPLQRLLLCPLGCLRRLFCS